MHRVQHVWFQLVNNTKTKFMKNLPEKWCIKVTNENKDVLGDWRTDGYLSNYAINCYLHTPMNGKNGWNQKTKETDYTEITFDQFKKYVLKQDTMKTTTIKKSVLKEIHDVACSTWKAKIENMTLRNAFSESIEVTQAEIDEMFAAATTEQIPILESIFGKQTEQIDFDRIKTGSKVIIKHTGQHCSGVEEINMQEPVDVVFYKTPQYINGDNCFRSTGSYSSYCTFHQNGKFILFSAHQNVDYITKVVEY